MASVSSVMTPNPATCHRHTALREVAHMMIDHECGQIPVVDNKGTLLGMVTDRDLAIRIVATGDDGKATAGEAMTAPARILLADSDLKDCLGLEETQLRRVPVVDASGKLAGIVSTADIVLAGRDEATAEAVTGVAMPGA